MTKENEIVVAEIVQNITAKFNGRVKFSLFDETRSSFFGKQLSKDTVLEIRLTETPVPETKTRNGRPAGSVKTLAV